MSHHERTNIAALNEAYDVEINERAVARQLLGLVLGVERKAQLANAVCWLIMVIAVMRLGDLAAFAIPLASRFIASPLTHLSFRRARRILDAGGSRSKAIRPVMVALVFGGASWASMIPPLLETSLNQPAAMLIFGSLVAGITIIITVLAPVPALALTYSTGFQITAMGLLIAGSSDGFGWGMLMAIDIMFLVFLAYAFAATDRQEETARTLVANRALTRKLERSLHEVAELAYRDALTGLMNRRSFFAFAADLDRETTRHVLTIDLDHFKAINDTFGHALGDQVLGRVGETLVEIVESLDGDEHCAARTGGEEFVMIVGLATADLAAAVAEETRLAIAGIAASLPHPDLRTTASIGICEWRPGQSLDDVLAESDRATYRAKSAGRNQVRRAVA